jgi:hypothetical protein
MSTQKSQAMTEFHNMISSLKSMNEPASPQSTGQAPRLDHSCEPHPMDTQRNPELFSEFCC